jgi:excisionase family DNA binding protein
VDELLAKLAERLQIYDSEIITADEIKDWPAGKLDELVEMGVLAEVEHSKGIVCDECEEGCFIEPEMRSDSTTGVFVCPRREDIGRIEVDLERLRRWKIGGEKLQSLGYRVDSGPEPEDELITVQEAANLSGMDRGTISKLASENKIKHNGETGTKRRISKLSILIYKNNRETEQLKKDFDDYREDLRKIPDKR